MTAYNGSPIAVAGKYIAFIRHKGQSTPILFIVTDASTTPILGLESSSRLNLIKRINSIDSTRTNDYLQEFQNSFGELGTLPMPYHIVTDPSIPSVIDACQNVPIPLHSKLEKELRHMQVLGIITPVSEPTDWVSSIVTVEKPTGSLKVCLDP